MTGESLLLAGEILLLFLLVAKLLAIGTAIYWIDNNGTQYALVMSKADLESMPEAYWAALDRNKGKMVVPFGVLEYRLDRERSALSERGELGRLRGLAIWTFQKVFDLTFLGPCTITLDVLIARRGPMSRDLLAILALTAGLLFMVGIFLIAIEATFSYARLGSYAAAWHGGAKYKTWTPSQRYLQEIYVLGGAIVFGLLIDVSLTYLVATSWGGYSNLPAERLAATSTVDGVGNSIYHAMSTFLTVDSAGPSDGLTRLVTVLIAGQAATFLVLVLSILSGFSSATVEEVKAAVTAASAESGSGPVPTAAFRAQSDSIDRTARTIALVVGAVVVATSMRRAKLARQRVSKN